MSSFQEDRLSANPELIGKTSLEVLDATIAGLTSAGLMVILNNHNSGAGNKIMIFSLTHSNCLSILGWCCSDNDGEGLWYTHNYPEDMWFAALEELTLRYKVNFKPLQ